MSRELTTDELKEVVGAARVYCMGFSEEKFQSLVEMGKQVADEGYLEAVRGLARLEREGIPCTKALNEYKALLRRLSDLERKTADAKVKLDTLEKDKQQAEGNSKQIKESVEQAQKELEQVKATRAREEKELADFRTAATREKERLDREVAKCQQKANVSKEDIATAGKLKTEVESHGLTLELMLDLAKEFTGYQNVQAELAGALKKWGTLQGYIASLDEQAQEKRKAVEVELNIAQVEKDKRQAEVRSLEATRSNFENILSHLQSDLAYEDEIRRFHRRYWGVSGLMEYLATWEQVLFLRCNNPISALAGVFNPPAGVARFWTDKPVVNCPHCGLKLVVFDEKAYSALNWPVGIQGRLQLGE